MKLKNVIRVVVAAAFVGVLAGCSAAEPVPTVDTAGAVIIDVRTPDEFAAGHLTGSVNIDVNGANFEHRISSFDPVGKYFVYCRSGNRSAQAVAKMQALGFSNVVDLGSVESASADTGLEVVR